MATGGQISSAKSAYTPVTRVPRLPPGTRRPRVGLRNEMKLTLRQRLGNWLLRNNNEDQYANVAVADQDSINSNGMRFQLYNASGGFVIETRVYDERNDRNVNKLYVITEDKDLGEELGKIITMESLR